MDIDIRTFVIVLAIVAEIQAIVSFFHYLINKTYRSVGWGIISSSLAAFGYVLSFHQGTKQILSITGICIAENGEPGRGVQFEIVVPKGMWRSTGIGA